MNRKQNGGRVMGGLLISVLTGSACMNYVQLGGDGDGVNSSSSDASVATRGGQEHPAFTYAERPDTPPISGGTMASSKEFIVASDPDRDQIYLVDRNRDVTTLKLNRRDEPGRVALEGNRAVVSLRGTGEFIELDLTSQTIVRRVKACVAARGIAIEPDTGNVFIACREGNLARFAPDGVLLSRIEVAFDLRDVVINKSDIYVSTFRSPRVFWLQRGEKGLTVAPEMVPMAGPRAAPMNAGFRLVHTASAGAVVVGQAAEDPAGESPQAYYVRPGARVVSTVIASEYVPHVPTYVDNQAPWAGAPLPVDMAVREAPGGTFGLVVAAGNTHPSTPVRSLVETSDFDQASILMVKHDPYKGWIPSDTPALRTTLQPIAAVNQGNVWVVQSREPAELVYLDEQLSVLQSVPLAKESVEDRGHAIFHTNAGGGVACAGCHLEGGEDGRVWTFFGKPRKTMSLLGTLAGTAPYHWDEGDATMRAVLDSVYTTRMAGKALQAPEAMSVSRWLEALPAPPPMSEDHAKIEKGKSIFNGSGECSACHSGPTLAGQGLRDVGLEEKMSTPSLRGLAWRPPFLHTGCAGTLEERFTKCSAPDAHGKTSHLTTVERADLIEYLKSL